MSTRSDPPIIKAICFDIADVLIELDIGYAISLLKQPQNSIFTEKIYTIGRWPTYDVFERGRLTENDFINQLGSYLEIDLKYTELVDWWNSSIRKMVDGVENILWQVFNHLPVFALTNTNPIHYRYLMSTMSVFSEFKGILTSFDLGYRKPEKKIFQKASKQIGLSSNNILFIDDNDINIMSAKEEGYYSERNYRSSKELSEILTKYGVF